MVTTRLTVGRQLSLFRSVNVQKIKEFQMKISNINAHQREILIQHIPLRKIDAPTSERAQRNLTEIIASVQRVGVQQPIKVICRGRRYQIIDGGRRYYACQRLGWSEIPAIIVEVDDLHAELIAIDLNLMREEFTPSERRAARQRRRELSRTIYKHRNGPRQGRRKDEPQACSAPAVDSPSSMQSTPRTIVQLIRRLMGIQDKRHSQAALL
jgi:ParB/RepB/Spo0J family partition protein